jgi:hypothetical protein
MRRELCADVVLFTTKTQSEADGSVSRVTYALESAGECDFTVDISGSRNVVLGSGGGGGTVTDQRCVTRVGNGSGERTSVGEVEMVGPASGYELKVNFSLQLASKGSHSETFPTLAPAHRNSDPATAATPASSHIVATRITTTTLAPHQHLRGGSGPDITLTPLTPIATTTSQRHHSLGVRIDTRSGRVWALQPGESRTWVREEPVLVLDGDPSASAARTIPSGLRDRGAGWRTSDRTDTGASNEKAQGGAATTGEEGVGMRRVYYTVGRLRSSSVPFPSGVDERSREQHLSDEEFHGVFGMGKAAFGALPRWKQHKMKKQVELF